MTTMALQIDPSALRRHRLMAAMTQHELARAAGIARITVSRLEQGGPASPYSVRRLARALGIDCAQIAFVVEIEVTA